MDNSSIYNGNHLHLITQRDLGHSLSAKFSANDKYVLGYHRVEKSIAVLLPRVDLPVYYQWAQMGHSLRGYSCHPHEALLAEIGSFAGWRAGHLFVRRLPNGFVENHLSFPNSHIHFVHYSPDGKWIVIMVAEKFLFLDSTTLQVVYEYPAGEHCWGLDFSPVDNIITAAIYNQADVEILTFRFPDDLLPYGAIPMEDNFESEKFWTDWYEWKYDKVLRIRHDDVNGPLISPDGKWIVVLHWYPELLSFPDLKLRHSWPSTAVGIDSFAYRVALDKMWLGSVFLDPKRLLCGSPDGIMYCWSIESGELLWQFQAHSARIISLALNRTGDVLISSGEDGNVKLWKVS